MMGANEFELLLRIKYIAEGSEEGKLYAKRIYDASKDIVVVREITAHLSEYCEINFLLGEAKND